MALRFYAVSPQIYGFLCKIGIFWYCSS